jgi:hypothetical protein
VSGGSGVGILRSEYCAGVHADDDKVPGRHVPRSNNGPVARREKRRDLTGTATISSVTSSAPLRARRAAVCPSSGFSSWPFPDLHVDWIMASGPSCMRCFANFLILEIWGWVGDLAPRGGERNEGS